MNRIKIFIAVVFIFTTKISAEIKLPSIFADGMVFQQSSNAPIWGKATPGNEIIVKTGRDNINCFLKVKFTDIHLNEVGVL
jgi:sialate O-acetylesterase